MYLKEVQHTKSIPLILKPTTELEAAIAEADRGEFVGSYNSIQDFKQAMNDDN